MKAEQFDKIVEARTNERANKKIEEFKQSVRDALVKMGVWVNNYSLNSDLTREEPRKIFAVLAKDPAKGWPREIWDRERAEVTKALLATFDEFQKALIAADRAEPGENSQEKPKCTCGSAGTGADKVRVWLPTCERHPTKESLAADEEVAP